MLERFQNLSALSALRARPAAVAHIKGDAEHLALRGTVSFFSHRNGVIVLAQLWGLPYDPAPCASNVFAMHIHAGGDCSGDVNTPFSGAGGHYAPNNCPHPAHAGDMPPLFGNSGYAWQGFYTERFTPGEIVGKTVILHGQRDDFTTQPAGDAGGRIGCGVIRASR